MDAGKVEEISGDEKKKEEGKGKGTNQLIEQLKKSILKWWMETRENKEVNAWLKSAKKYEKSKNYRKALEAYFNFIEAKLKIIASRPGYTLQSYYALIPYYIKIAELYQSIKHFTPEEKARDYRKSAEYYCKVADMYLEQKDYDNSNKYLELASITYEDVGAYDKAAECHLKIADNYMKLNNYLLVVSSYQKAAGYYEKAGRYKDAYDLYIKSAEMNSDLGDDIAASSCYRKAGELLRSLGEHEKAVELYFKSSEVDSRIGRYHDVAKAYIGIAKDYEETNKLDEAAHYYILAGDSSMYYDEITAISSYYNAAKCYQKLSNYKDAIYYYNKSANLSLKAKRPIDTAKSYWKLAECYRALDDLEKSAEFYYKYGKCTEEINDSEGLAVKGYRKAAELYKRIADGELENKNLDRAIKYYKLAAESFDKLDDFITSGDLYFRAGSLEEEKGYGTTLDTITNAIQEYKKAKRLDRAAECYIAINDYESAAETYSEYADFFLSKNNLFRAAHYHKLAGDSYKKINRKEQMRNLYNKSIQEYLKYIELIERKEIIETEEANVGNALFGIAEAYRELDKLIDAEKYFEKALTYYKEKNDHANIALSEAFLAKVSGKLIIKQGNYKKGSKLLQRAVEYFRKSIEIGNLDKKYIKFLEKNIKECEDILSEIGRKPEVSLTLDRYAYTFTNRLLPINITIANRGEQRICKINFLPQFPENFSIINSPSGLKELETGKTVKTSIEIKVDKPGEYKLIPMELLYEDEKGEKYVKSSNPITIEVIEEPHLGSIKLDNIQDIISTYKKYAITNLNNNNYMQAGDGFKGIGDCYKKLSPQDKKNEIEMKNSYARAIQLYLKFINSIPEDKELSADRLDLLGEVYRRIAQCHENLNDLKNSERYLEDSNNYFKMASDKVIRIEDKTRIEQKIKINDAMASKIRAKLLINENNYEDATKLLEKSVSILKDSMERGGWDKEYGEFLNDNLKEAENLLKKLKNQHVE